jgi:XTP/dITP diphosphohydrolase
VLRAFFHRKRTNKHSKRKEFFKMKNRESIASLAQKEVFSFDDLCELVRVLRSEDGCSWDREQNHHTVRSSLIEETYEVVEAIDSEDMTLMREELGDLLFQVLFHAQMEAEAGSFSMDDVIGDICKKMIHRHPHVFAAAEVGSAEDVIKQWEMLKTTEKDGNKRVLSGVPDGLPPLLKAYRMQDKARGVGFDWECKEQVWDKVKEEMGEYQAELDAMAAAQTDEEKAAAYDRAEDELGDFLFATVNAARLYGLNPDTALERTCAKFKRRFTYLEEQTIRQGRNLTDMTLAEMDAIWDEGKAKGL